MRPPTLLVLSVALSVLYGISPERTVAGESAPALVSDVAPSLPKISEAEIRSLIADIQAAVKNRDTREIVKYYAPFIVSRLTIESGDRSETFQLDGLKENEEYLENTWKKIRAIEVLADNWDVDILATDEMGLIRRERTVVVTDTEGKRYIVRSEAVARVAHVDGGLKIISIDETARASRRPDNSTSSRR
jgi:DNA polymerase III delta prime subunit